MAWDKYVPRFLMCYGRKLTNLIMAWNILYVPRFSNMLHERKLTNLITAWDIYVRRFSNMLHERKLTNWITAWERTYTCHTKQITALFLLSSLR